MKRTVLLLTSLLAGSWSGSGAAQTPPPAPPNTPPATLEAKAAALAIRRQMVQLDEVERLLDERAYEAASSSLAKLISEAKDERVLERARKLWERSHPGWQSLLLARLLGWLNDLLPYLTVIALVVLFLWIRRIWNRRRTDHWTLEEVVDSSGFGMGQLIASYFSFWAAQESAPVTSGLLLLEASRIPLTPEFEVRDHFDLSKELESVPLTVGGFNIAGAAKLVGVFGRWFSSGRQEIRGMSYWLDETQLIARLTARYSRRGKRDRMKPLDDLVTVTASVDKSAPDAARTVAEEVTFKMLYTLAKKQSPYVGERANELRQGLDKLRAYLSGESTPERKPWQMLEEAAETFERVRQAWPESLEAYLYAGVALDLLERHEEAIERFTYIMGKTEDMGKDDPMYLRAAYNEAIAQLRNLYQLPGIEACIEHVEKFVGNSPQTKDLEASPIKALAVAVKADAVASRVLHWEKVFDEKFANEAPGPSTSEAKLQRVISYCVEEVENLLGLVEPFLKAGPKAEDSPWDDDTVRQLEWAIHNARADLYLYSVVPEAGSSLPRYEEYLEKARSALRKCEMLMPPGVETLTNLGTFFLLRNRPGDFVEARRYLTRAIELNPYYEYAYYRLAQSWEREQWREKVIEVLRSFKRPVGISRFREMYRKYYVQPVEL